MANDKWSDQTLYCDRCGISFLWSTEEQKAAQNSSGARPVYCAGCRALLPAPGRERGVVKWFNGRKRYGFVVRKDQPEIFVHGSDVQGDSRLQPGDLVEFGVGAGDQGPVARAVTVVGHLAEPLSDV